MTSLRRRILLGGAALVVATVGISVTLVFAVARWQAVDLLDLELAEHAQRMRFMSERGPPPPLPGARRESAGDDGQPMPPGWDGEKRRLFFELRDADSGRVLMRPVDSPDLASALDGLPDHLPSWRSLPDGRHLRGIRVPVAVAWSGSATRRVTGLIAIDATAIDQELSRLGAKLLAVWAIAAGIAIIAAVWLQRAVIGPLDRLAADLRGIDPERLDGRVGEHVPAEMAAATRLLNELLDRLSRLRERERSTIASIAHELRSPVSGLRTTLEVAALDRSGSADALAARLLPTVSAMHAMVANLLALARIEAGLERCDPQPVLLDEVIDRSWQRVHAAAAERCLRLLRTGEAGIVACSNPEHLDMVLGNLLDNAVAYAPEESEISLHRARDGTHAVVVLSNPIDGGAPDLAQVFTPFWRSDPARSSGRHCGLGLALARRLCGLMRAEIAVSIEDGRFVATVRLPMHAGCDGSPMHG